MSGVVFTGADGSPLSPGALCYRVVEVAADVAASARRDAYTDGMVIEEPDRALYGLGLAARLCFPAGLAAFGAARSAIAGLQAITGQAPAGRFPIALGALPFDSRAPGSLVIPRQLLVSDARGDLLITVGVGEAGGGGPSLAATFAPPPDEFTVSSESSDDDYLEKVAEALAAIAGGVLDKVVLARAVRTRANRPYRQADLLAGLRKLHPACAVFALEGFLGATPELLIDRSGATAVSRPLAGTVARGDDPQADAARIAALSSSEKERREHRLGVEPIEATLRSLGGEVGSDLAPHVVELANVFHLETEVTAEFAKGAPSALELAAALHPTPAVAGAPAASACAYLAEHEALGRDRYAGPLGYLDAGGDGRFYLGIRSADVTGGEARLIAGAGIVAGSDPQAELAETNAKLEALLPVFTAR